MGLCQAAGERHLWLAQRRGSEPALACGRVDVVDSRDRKHLPTAVASGLKIFCILCWTPVFHARKFQPHDGESDGARPVCARAGFGTDTAVAKPASGLEPMAFVAGGSHAVGLA